MNAVRKSNKFLNFSDLYDWADEFHSDVFFEWEISGLAEHIDFWNWLKSEHPDLVDEFKKWWRERR